MAKAGACACCRAGVCRLTLHGSAAGVLTASVGTANLSSDTLRVHSLPALYAYFALFVW